MTVDGGSSAPILGQTVSTVHHTRTAQEDMHAALVPPEVLVVQVGRFEYHGDTNLSVKHRPSVVPDMDIQLPCFVRDMQTRHVPYRLRAAFIHKGLSPNSGHYVALLYDETDTHPGNVWFADDGAPAVRITDDEVVAMYRDIYILFYTRTA